MKFNPPPGWPKPPEGWKPPKGWAPDPAWPAPPPGWQLWLPIDASHLEDRASSRTDSVLPIGVGTPKVHMDERIAALEAENASLRSKLEEIRRSTGAVIDLNDDKVLQEAGVYRYHHPLENAAAYRDHLAELSTRIAERIKDGSAIEASSEFTLDGSLAKGRSMTADLSRLMLRAYNAEAENVVRTLRIGTNDTAIRRLEAARTAIAKLGRLMAIRISDAYHDLRVEEVKLVGDYLAKKEEEREAARAERERLREERKVEQELAAAREKLEKEKAHLVTVIEKLSAKGEADPDLDAKLAAVNGAIAQNDFRAANIRAGYVYVISNRGAFGERVVKIGLTRRLEPLDRIHELGDASVPFRFDVHAIYFSEDAVALEGQLHEHFAARRLNWANDRKEFFFASPAEVRAVLEEKLGNLLEFVEHAESTEYLQSVGYWPDESAAPGPSHRDNSLDVQRR